VRWTLQARTKEFGVFSAVGSILQRLSDAEILKNYTKIFA
jgi:hypothetical protein